MNEFRSFVNLMDRPRDLEQLYQKHGFEFPSWWSCEDMNRQFF